MVLILSIRGFWGKINYKIDEKSHGADGDNYIFEIFHGPCNDALKECAVLRKRTLMIAINGIVYFYLHKELSNFKKYRKMLHLDLAKRGINVVKLQVVMPSSQIIDWTWNRLLTYLLWEKIEIEHLMSWLSTLGGGFSALGEQFSKCAEVAGKISMKQLHIGIRLGDPFLQARCKLYYSISLMQTGRLRAAKYLIRQQYAFARSCKDIDCRLIKMCQGIWHRLQFEYGMRQLQRQMELDRLRYEGAGDK